MEVLDLNKKQHPVETVTLVYLNTLPLLRLLQVHQTVQSSLPPQIDLQLLFGGVVHCVALEEGRLAGHELADTQNVELRTRVHL